LEGDTVLLDKKRRPIVKEGPEPEEARAWDAWKGKAVVPQGHIWVEGDNRLSSVDSNDYGPVSKSLINGRAIAVVLPFSKFWTQPWTDYKSKTKIKRCDGDVKEWTNGLPVELAEIANPHAPP
jgi:inner membrane protease subunit 2